MNCLPQKILSNLGGGLGKNRSVQINPRAIHSSQLSPIITWASRKMPEIIEVRPKIAIFVNEVSAK